MNTTMSEPKAGAAAHPARHFISGLSSGVASAIILQPLDLLKTRVQQSGRSTLRETFRSLTKSSNLVSALWRGTVPSTLRTGIGSALYFTSLNTIRQNAGQLGFGGRRLASHGRSSALPTISNTANLISGAAARTFAAFMLMPLTVIKVRFESNLYNYPSLWAAAGDIRRTRGLRGYFSGFGATALRDAPYAGSYVFLYEILKKQLGHIAAAVAPPRGIAGNMSMSAATAVNAGSATLAGVACSVLSNPFDAIKTRIQLQPDQYTNIWRTARKMIAEDGVRSLWDGLGLRMGRKVLSSVLAWTVYEELIRRAGSRQGLHSSQGEVRL